MRTDDMRAQRARLAETIDGQLGPFDPAHLRALVEVPRERFVRHDDAARAADDTPLPLDDVGLATISAPHAYLLSFRLLDLASGDRLVELGSGSGYGAALAAYIVGPRGSVITIEIDGRLAEWAALTLAQHSNVAVLHADAVTAIAAMADAEKIVVTFAVSAIPEMWLDAIPEGGCLVAPVGSRDRDQRLVRVRRTAGALVRTEHGAVRYVPNRSPRVN